MAIIDVNILTLCLLFPISNTSLFSIVQIDERHAGKECSFNLHHDVEYTCKWKQTLQDQSTTIDKVSISSTHHYEGICAYSFSDVCEQ